MSWIKTHWSIVTIGFITVVMLGYLVAYRIEKAEVTALEAKVENITRALEQEKLSTSGALAAEKAQEEESADLRRRSDAAVAGLRSQLDAYRAQLARCADAKSTAEGLGRLFPAGTP